MIYLRDRLKKMIQRIVSASANYNVISISTSGSVGEKVKLKNAKITGNVKIEENVKIIEGVNILGLSSVVVGRYSVINGPNTDIIARVNSVEIGAFTSIARGVTIQEFNHHANRLSTYFMNHNVFNGNGADDIASKGSIEIGNDVWIGAQCIILSGAKIGDGAIIGANSVVVNSIPPFAIAVGSPAKVISYRFSQNTINVLLETAWWKWPIEKIIKNKKFFSREINEDQLTRELLNLS